VARSRIESVELLLDWLQVIAGTAGKHA
jgi:trehalose 6-phosphate phosphatase